MPKAINLAGVRYGRLVAISPEKGSRRSKRRWLCRCDCGGNAVVETNHLISGNTHSCGCLQREVQSANCERRIRTHGMKGTREYGTWSSMRSRCENSKHPAWKNYGGRGISVCKRWQSFENFYADMGDKPKAMELDRIDNNGNYEPWNCRWITRSDNIKNIRPECRFKFPIYRGESNANAKLSDEQCGAMRKDYALGGISQKKIAEAYGIGQSHVSRIIREESRRSS